MKTKIKNYKAKNTVLKQEPIAHLHFEQGWYGDNIQIPYSKAYEIGAFKGSTLWGYLPETYDIPVWQNALSKGFAKQAKGAAGVKSINDTVLELKTLQAQYKDARLYTKVIHKNDDGNGFYLAIFDRECDHKGVNKLANSTNELTIYEDCQSQIENTLLGDSHYEVCEA